MLPLSGWPHVTADTRIGTQQKNRNSPQWIAHWWADQGHWWYVVEKSSPDKSRPRHDVACTSSLHAALLLFACGELRIHAGRAVCNQRMFLDKDKRPCLISPLIFKRTACNFRLSFSVACMRRFSFLLVLENLAAAVSHGDKASMLCNLNTHTHTPTPWMSALLGPALSLFAWCRSYAAVRRLRDPPCSRNDTMACVVDPAFCFMRPSFPLPMFLSNAACRRISLQTRWQAIMPTQHYNYNCTTPHYIQQLWWGDHCNYCNQQTTQLQPLFGPSVGSLCHPWVRTTNLSYRFPSLKLPPPPCAVLPVNGE